MLIDSVYIKIGYTEFEAKNITKNVINEFLNEFIQRSLNKRLKEKKLNGPILWSAVETIGVGYLHYDPPPAHLVGKHALKFTTTTESITDDK